MLQFHWCVPTLLESTEAELHTHVSYLRTVSKIDCDQVETKNLDPQYFHQIEPKLRRL